MTIFEMGAGERYEVVTVLHRFSLYLTRNSTGVESLGGGGVDWMGYEVVTVLHRFLLYLRNSYGGWIFGGGGGGGGRTGGPDGSTWN